VDHDGSVVVVVIVALTEPEGASTVCSTRLPAASHASA